MRKKTSTIEYLAFLSAKYDVDPDKLFYSLVAAAENRRSECAELSIKQRGETQDKVMFLILKSTKVVAQLSVFKDFLSSEGHPIRDFMGSDKIQRFLVKKAKQSGDVPIRDLRIGMTQICLKAKVVEIPKPSIVYTRFGNCANVSNVLIADETGTIRLCLWNEQINSISAGDTIQIKNARTSMFRGQRQLYVGRKGLVESIDESDWQVKPLVIS